MTKLYKCSIWKLTFISFLELIFIYNNFVDQLTKQINKTNVPNSFIRHLICTNTKLSVSHNSNKIIIIASDKRHTTYGTSCKSIHRNRQDNSGIFCNSVNESAKLIKSITNGNNMVVISPCHMEKAGLIQFCYDKPVCKPKRY